MRLLRNEARSPSESWPAGLFVFFLSAACASEADTSTRLLLDGGPATSRSDAVAEDAGLSGPPSIHPEGGLSPSSEAGRNSEPDGGDAGKKLPDAGSRADASRPPPPACTPTYTSCSGLCGPVVDACTGEQFECGGCGEGFACDVRTHRCVAPKVSCEALGAECGRIRNTCGARLDCGDCPDGFECDPETNTCTGCQDPSCMDLGFECGKAWLGCGSREVLTDCGTCEEGHVCNAAYNRCEPAPESEGGECVPGSADVRCAAEGAECGFVSDGCGGLVECGECPEGKECATQGISNRCGPPEPPWECAVEGRECGRLTSACKGELSCGNCAAGTVCNDNGKCGDPCTPSLPEAARRVECGLFDDGCGGTMKKDCPGGATCLENGTCCTPRTCTGDYGGECGSGLPDGCGGTIDCGCGAAQLCRATEEGTPGSCCALPTRPDASFCGSLDNACGTRTFTCGAGRACSDGTCCDLPSCEDRCDVTVQSACGGRVCRCTGGATCVSGRCCTPRTCAKDYAGACGTDLSDGCGGTIDCGCRGAASECSVTSPGSIGECSCKPLTCADYPMQCGTFPDRCGRTLSCSCAGHGLPDHMTCGGSGVAGVCGCKPVSCAGRCGLVDDGCGRTVDCGPC